MSHFVVTSSDYSKGTRHDYMHDAIEAAEKLSLATNAPVVLAQVGRYGDVSRVYKLRFSKVDTKKAANPKYTVENFVGDRVHVTAKGRKDAVKEGARKLWRKPGTRVKATHVGGDKDTSAYHVTAGSRRGALFVSLDKRKRSLMR